MPKPDYELPDFDILEDDAPAILDLDDLEPSSDPDWVDACLDALHQSGEEAEAPIPQWLPWDLPDFIERYKR